MMNKQRMVYSITALLVVLNGQGAMGFSPSASVIHKNGAAVRKRSFVSTLPSKGLSTILQSTNSAAATSSKQQQDPMDVFQQAREFAYGDDLEFEEHYHPYRDYQTKLDETNLWLRELNELQQSFNGEEMSKVVTKLQQKAKRYEKRMHKGESANSVIPSIALELSLGALVMIVAVFWTTLDMTQRHGVTPLHFQDWLGLAQEKGYLINMFDLGNVMNF